jgi:hypothetical protein
MTEFEAFLDKMRGTRADHLPVIAAFCNRIGLTEVIDRVVPTEMEVSVGTIIQGMILDTLSGRSPLYRLIEFFKHQNTDALLGKDGNASDKSINNAVLSRISKHMAKYGLQPGAFVYIADSAMVMALNETFPFSKIPSSSMNRLIG